MALPTFTVTNYIGDEKSGVTVWEWEAVGTLHFLGIPTNGKSIKTTGVCVHTFNEQGRIKSELAYWDAVTVGQQLGLNVDGQGFQNSEYWDNFE